MTVSHSNIDSLLRHQDWVRALARSLVADPARAEDVAQQTMLEAIEKAPGDLKQPKGWLATVARNTARALARSDRRRLAREATVAKDDVDHADPADAAQRAAAHKSLVDALFELEEPYHSVVLLRYFEDLEPQQIAEQLGRSASTVRTQLQRGLARMRDALDQRYGDRHALHAALLPLFAGRKAALASATGVPVLAGIGSLMMFKIFVPLAAALAAMLFAWQAMFPEAPAVPASTDKVVTASRGDVSQAAAPSAEREPAAVAELPLDPGADQPLRQPKAGGFAARAVLVDGSPAVGMTMAYSDPNRPRLEGTRLVIGPMSIDTAQPAVKSQLEQPHGLIAFASTYGSDADAVQALLSGEPLDRPRGSCDHEGRFRLPVPKSIATKAADHLQLERDGWMVYGYGKVDPLGAAADPGAEELVYVVGPATSVGGIVVDESGQPIEDVYVHFGLALQSLPGYGQRLVQTSYRSWNAHSTSVGAFVLGAVPAQRAVRITVQKRGYQSLSVPVGQVLGPVRWVMKEKALPKRAQLRGIVRHHDGTPAAGAHVVYGYGRGTCDDEGRFAFDHRQAKPGTELVAYLGGLQPAVQADFRERVAADPELAHRIELQLGPAALSIAGQVLDEAGRPVRNALVVLADGTTDGNASRFVESYVGGQKSRGERTDRQGRFELKGLGQRDYTVRAIDEGRRLVAVSDPVAAGTQDLALSLDASDVFALDGVCVDRLGHPVANAEVALRAPGMQTKAGTYWLAVSETLRTDSMGRFAFPHCPKQQTWLEVGGSGLEWQSSEVDQAEATSLRIVVKRIHKLKLRVTSSRRADQFAVLDDEGEQLFVKCHMLGVVRAFKRHSIDADNDPFYEVDDRGVEILLLRDKQEVGRVPLNLRVGQFTVVDV